MQRDGVLTSFILAAAPAHIVNVNVFGRRTRRARRAITGVPPHTALTVLIPSMLILLLYDVSLLEDFLHTELNIPWSSGANHRVGVTDIRRCAGASKLRRI